MFLYFFISLFLLCSFFYACFAIGGGGHTHGHITREEIRDPRFTSITIPLRVREQLREHRLERFACLDKSARGLFQQHRLQRDLQCHEAFHGVDVATNTVI